MWSNVFTFCWPWRNYFMLHFYSNSDTSLPINNIHIEVYTHTYTYITYNTRNSPNKGLDMFWDCWDLGEIGLGTRGVLELWGILGRHLGRKETQTKTIQRLYLTKFCWLKKGKGTDKRERLTNYLLYIKTIGEGKGKEQRKTKKEQKGRKPKEDFRPQI